MAVTNTLPKNTLPNTMRKPLDNGFEDMNEVSNAFKELGVNTTILSVLNYQNNSSVANTNSIT